MFFSIPQRPFALQVSWHLETGDRATSDVPLFSAPVLFMPGHAAS